MKTTRSLIIILIIFMTHVTMGNVFGLSMTQNSKQETNISSNLNDENVESHNVKPKTPEVIIKDSIDKVRLPLYDWREKKLEAFRNEAGIASYAYITSLWSRTHYDFIKLPKFPTVAEIDLIEENILQMVMDYILYNQDLSDPAFLLLFCRYATRLYETGYSEEALIFVEYALEYCEENKIYGNVYGELRSLELMIESEKQPSEKFFRKQCDIKNIFEKMCDENPNDESYEDYKRHTFRAVDLAMRADMTEMADSILTGYLLKTDPKYDPDVISGKVSYIEEKPNRGFVNLVYHNEINRLRNSEFDIDAGLEVLDGFYDNMIFGKLPSEEYDYCFNTVEMLSKADGFKEGSDRFLRMVSGYVYNYLSEVSPTISKGLRDDYYDRARHIINILNYEMVNYPDSLISEEVFDNALLFKGLNLQKERNLNNNDNYLPLDLPEIDKNKDAFWQLLIVFNELHKNSRVNELRALNSGEFGEWLSVKWDLVKNALEDGELAVEFFKVRKQQEDFYYAATVEKNSEYPRIVEIASHSDLTRRPIEYSLSDPLFSKMIWGEILKDNKDIKKIIFSPEGLLYTIPIESLPDFEGNGLLNECIDFVRVSSSKELVINSKKDSGIKKALLIGGIDYDKQSVMLPDSTVYRGDFGYLEGTVEEVNAISDLLVENKWSVENLSSSLASEFNFREAADNKPYIIHIATHGFYYNESASIPSEFSFLTKAINKNKKDNSMMRTGLLLSGINENLGKDSVPDSNNDGLLLSSEIVRMNLNNTDLVVLSACQTGLGDIDGDGVYGLQRGFKIAGVNSLLFSLWKVEDVVTTMLMKEFYKNLLAGENKRRALLKAQKKIREFEGVINGKFRNLSDPVHWGAFVLLDALE